MIFIFVTLYPKFPLIRVPGTFVSIRIEDFLLALSGILFLFLVSSSLRSFLKDQINRSILIFLLSGFISLLSAIFITSTVVPHIGFLHWLRRVEYFIPFFIGLEFARRNPNAIDYFVKIIFVVIAIVFIYGFGQRYLDWPMVITQNEEYSKGIALRYVEGAHINSTFAGHYDLAAFLVLTLPIVVSIFVSSNEKKTKITSFFIWLSGLWLLVNAASRISFVSYILAVVISLVFLKKYRTILLVLIVSFLFTFFSPSLMSRYMRIFKVTSERFLEFNLLNYLYKPKLVLAQSEILFENNENFSPTKNEVQSEDRSTNIRLNVEWPRALRAFTKNPILGTGYSSITLATDNDFLRLLGEVGILGFLSFFLIFINILRRFLLFFPLQQYKDVAVLSLIGGVLGALPGIFLNAFFIDIFEASKFAICFWLIMGMCISLLERKK